jgi:hypothetical protein
VEMLNIVLASVNEIIAGLGYKRAWLDSCHARLLPNEESKTGSVSAICLLQK